MSALAPTLQAFFTERLLAQRRASPHTIAAYRDAFCLLLGFVEDEVGKPPAKLDLEDLDAPLIGAFLDHLERDRGNGVRTRNARLAAIHSLYRFAALRHPENAWLIERVLAIPPKRSSGRSSASSPIQRSRRSWQPPTAVRSLAAGTTLCCSLRSRRGCGSPSSSASGAKTPCSAPERTCDASARGERNGRRR